MKFKTVVNIVWRLLRFLEFHDAFQELPDLVRRQTSNEFVHNFALAICEHGGNGCYA